jgi:AAA15 family ATPase/GTPase
MIASRQRTHQEHLSQIQKYQTRITPVAALYGGNASGKSNICTALKFAKDMVIKGTKTRDQKIDVQPFLLSNDTKDKPSKFRFELLVNECLYEFYFAVTEDRIYEEKLTKIGLTKEQVLYERENQNFIINENNNQNKSHLDNIKISTRENELFLTKTIENNNSSYQDPYDWFFHILKIISPISTFAEPEYLTNKNHPLYEEANSILRELDTGILHLGTEVDKEIDLNKLDKEAETLLNVLGRLNNEKYIKYSQNGEKLVKKLISYHMCEDGTETQFNWKQESDGTKRLFDLIPAFIQIKPSVYY